MKKVLIIVGVLLAPLIISLLLKVHIFSFSMGDVESWIAFWGSYVGALIGAATVYLVTNLQVKEQRELQLQAIKLEHNNSLQREMRQFHFINDIEKIEEFDDLLEETLDSISKCVNDFTKYITYSHILYGGVDKYTKDEKERFEEEIKKLHTEVYNWIHKLTRSVMKMNRLSAYIQETTLPVGELHRKLEKFVTELREGYNDKYSFKKYPDFDAPPLLPHLNDFTQKIYQLKRDILDPRLNERISEMKQYSNL
jgi:gas vesicle protein